MPLDLTDCRFQGPALPEPFVKRELHRELTRLGLLPDVAINDNAAALRAAWENYRQSLGARNRGKDAQAVQVRAVQPLLGILGYTSMEAAPAVATSCGLEPGGLLLAGPDQSRAGQSRADQSRADQSRLRVWAAAHDARLFAQAQPCQPQRYCLVQTAQRVLLATGERLGLLTNGTCLVLLLADPAQLPSTVTIPITDWHHRRDVPDAFRFLLAMASPAGVRAVATIVAKALLGQTRRVKQLRKQVAAAAQGFVQEVLDHPANYDWLRQQADRAQLAQDLWRQGLAIVYRLLFALKLKAGEDGGPSDHDGHCHWPQLLSPGPALARHVEEVLRSGSHVDRVCSDSPLEQPLRRVLRRVSAQPAGDGFASSPRDAVLPGTDAARSLDSLCWGECAVAHLLDQLLWLPRSEHGSAGRREPIHYASLEVEDLGRSYEGLLELEPGIAAEPMCRLRRKKREVVLPAAEGKAYRCGTDDAGRAAEVTRWIEEIPPGRFYLRASLGRKSTGSYYTPRALVRFLVQESLEPQVVACSPGDDPHPAKILGLKVLDPAMGAGHFLVEACRFLGEKLYEACRLCAEFALAAEREAKHAIPSEGRSPDEQARRWRNRLRALPYPGERLLACLPGGAMHEEASGDVQSQDTDLADTQEQALALCRRLVAMHCLYGVDRNPLAVELTRLALVVEAHVEGLPLASLQHRLVQGDSLTGPFFEHLRSLPGNPQQPLAAGDADALQAALRQTLHDAPHNASHNALPGPRESHRGGESAAVDVCPSADGSKLDKSLLPFRVLAAAWSGGVMLGPARCDDAAYARLARHVSAHRQLPEQIVSRSLRAMIARGLGVEAVPADLKSLCALMQSGHCVPALPYDLVFPEVFYPGGEANRRQGFHAVLGNPPWDAVRPRRGEFFGSLDLQALAGYTKREREAAEARLLKKPAVAAKHREYIDEIEGWKRAYDRLYDYQKITVGGDLAGRYLDQYRIFMEKGAAVVRPSGRVGLVIPAAFRANAGAVGIRRLYMLENRLECCYTFRNTRQLFDASGGLQFCVIVCAFGAGPTAAVDVAFDIDTDGWLFAANRHPAALVYPLELIQATGGPHLTIVKLPTEEDVRLMLQLARFSCPLGDHALFQTIQFQTNPAALNATKDSWRLEDTHQVCQGDPRDPQQQLLLLGRGYVPLHEKGTFSRYCGREREQPRYVVNMQRCKDRPDLIEQMRYYRLVGRSAIHASETEKAVFAMIPPAGLVSNSAMVEAAPLQRPNAHALLALAILNSHIFNYLAAQQVVLNLNLFILRNLYIPRDVLSAEFLAHSALRLVANDAAYVPLWYEQLGQVWREPGKRPFSWPVLAEEGQRRALRAAIDAIVAQAYGLSREQYAHVLKASTPLPGEEKLHGCLSCFDELQALGLDAYCSRYDPYHGVPLNENLPQVALEEW